MSGRSRWTQHAIAIPMAYALGALVLGIVLPRLEAHYLPWLTGEASPGAAMTFLAAIASGMLPLTGLVFSLAFVMVTFSATAYSPRLVAWLAGSEMMSHSLGIFTAAFLYALAAIPWIDRGGSGRVPFLTLLVAVVLLLLSIFAFVLLVEKLGSLQISRVLAWTGDQGRSVIERDYRPLTDAPGPQPATALAPARQVLVHRGGPEAVQAIDIPGLVALAAQEKAVVVLAVAVGDTAVEGLPLLRVHGAGAPVPEARLRRLVRLGPERTFEQDPKYAIRLLVDIAIRALSPAINDPTTAVQALDQIEDLLLRLGQRDLAVGHARDAHGELRLVFPVPTWDDFLILAFDEIRYCGANSIQVMRRMQALLNDLAQQVAPERRPALQRHLARVEAGIHRAFDDESDKRDALESDRQGLGLPREKLRP